MVVFFRILLFYVFQFSQPNDKQTDIYLYTHGEHRGLPFLIDDDQLNSMRSLDFEVQSSLNVTVRSTVSGSPGLSLINTFQISIVGKLRVAVVLDYFAVSG